MNKKTQIVLLLNKIGDKLVRRTRFNKIAKRCDQTDNSKEKRKS